MSEHVDRVIQLIDNVLEAPPISIQDALVHAVSKGRMTQDEADECLEAYERWCGLFEEQPLGEVPLIPPYDSEGRYL